MTSEEKQTKESWVVIGGGGFVGNALVEELIKRDINVLSVDLSFPRQTTIPDFETRIASITNESAMIECTRGRTVVVNACAVIEDSSQTLLEKVNYLGVLILLKACKINRVKKFIQISSAGIHFDGINHLRDINEDYQTATEGLFSYNVFKAKSDAAVLDNNEENGLMTATLRPTSIYGPNDSGATKELYKIMLHKKSNAKLYFGPVSTLCDYTYIDNFVHSIILTAEKMGTVKGVSGNAFFINDGTPFYFWDFFKYFLEGLGAKNAASIHIPSFIITIVVYMNIYISPVLSLFNIKLPPVTKMRVALITRDRYYNISKARNLLGYEPLISTKEGLNRCISYWSSKL